MNTELLLAVGQFLAAGAIAWFTYKLAQFTRGYVRETSRLAELQSQSNQIQAAMLSQQVSQTDQETRAAAPALTVVQSGRKVDEQTAAAPLVVRNLGTSNAYKLEVHTDWGKAQVTQPIPPGGETTTAVVIPRDQWKKGSDPVVSHWVFTDPRGKRWRQEPGKLPVPAPD